MQMPANFITAKFDDVLESKLGELSSGVRAALGHADLQCHRPHITFAAYCDVTAPVLEDRLRAFCARHRTLPVEFRSLACFVPKHVVCAGPVVSSDLLALHHELHEHFAHPTEFAHHLAPGAWAPHCTLYVASTVDEMVRALELMSAEFDRLEGEIVGFGILEPLSVIDFFQCALES